MSNIHRFGIGTLHLPGESICSDIIRYAIDSGMLFIDCCKFYNDSDIKVGKALKNGYRDKVIVSSKWSQFRLRADNEDTPTEAGILRYVENSLKRMDLEYLDFFQIWSINSSDEYYKIIENGGILDGLLKAKNKKFIKNIGVSFHAPSIFIEDIITKMDWCDLILLPYNISDKSYLPSIEKSKKLGKTVATMSPLLGGKLIAQLKQFHPLLQLSGSNTFEELAIRYVFSNLNVDYVLSGISKKSDVDSDIEISKQNVFTKDLCKHIDEFMSVNNRKICTGCRYCIPCPRNIDIPSIMEAVYQYRYLGNANYGKELYSKEINKCCDCRMCISKCTQHINIPKELQYAETAFQNIFKK